MLTLQSLVRLYAQTFYIPEYEGCGLFQFRTPVLQSTDDGAFFQGNWFCFFVSFFYWFRFLEQVRSTLCFERPFLKFYILIVFVKHLFKFLLCLFRPVQNHREEEPVLISVPFLAGARTVRYCIRDMLRTAGDIDRRADSANGTSLPRSHASGPGLVVVHCCRIPFLTSILWTIALWLGCCARHPRLAKILWVYSGVTAGLWRQQFVMYMGSVCGL
jgi:hypothetical protein